MWVVLERDLVDCCKAGDDVTVTGIVRQRWKPLGYTFFHLPIYISIYPSIHPFINPFIHLPIYSSIYPSIHPSIYLFIHLSIHSSIYPSIHPSTYLFIRLPIHSSIYPSIHPSIHLHLLFRAGYPCSLELVIQANHIFINSEHRSSVNVTDELVREMI